MFLGQRWLSPRWKKWPVRLWVVHGAGLDLIYIFISSKRQPNIIDIGEVRLPRNTHNHAYMPILHQFHQCPMSIICIFFGYGGAPSDCVRCSCHSGSLLSASITGRKITHSRKSILGRVTQSHVASSSARENNYSVWRQNDFRRKWRSLISSVVDANRVAASYRY